MDECVFAGPLSRLVLAANASGKSLLNNFESASLPATCSLTVYTSTLYAIYICIPPLGMRFIGSLLLPQLPVPLSQLLNLYQASFFTILCAPDSIVLAQYLFDSCYQNALCDYRKNAWLHLLNARPASNKSLKGLKAARQLINESSSGGERGVRACKSPSPQSIKLGAGNKLRPLANEMKSK